MTHTRVIFDVGKRKFAALWQPDQRMWDVYRMRGGLVTEVFVRGMPDVRTAKRIVRQRLSN